MTKVVRNYLLADAQLKILLDNKEAIYQIEKPKEIKNDTYIVFFLKPLSGGFVKDWQLEFRVISYDLSKIVAIQSRLIKLLDDPRGEIIIKDEETVIRSIKLINGGGSWRNPETDNFEMVVYFLLRV
ncbi:MAG: hypothetical protein APF84_12435 [Gracilibacter sp. BRH_c7a]|nr:MAG: hypothetical protein APF84_12435 [Gracilibacter sp. BRH_c7a]